jgi:hypothetical protein
LKLLGPFPTCLQYLTVSDGVRSISATSAVVRYLVVINASMRELAGDYVDNYDRVVAWLSSTIGVQSMAGCA